MKRLRHGHRAKGARTPTYNTWRAMKQQCDRPNHDAYPSYGGRGIRYAEAWARFEAFLQDVGERPPGTTLDRIDPDGHYELSNVRWATDNRRRY